MAKFWKRIIKGEAGQALPVVLILLVLGGMLIAPSLSYAASSLDSGQNTMRNVNGLYAADAGVQDTIWCLKKGVPTNTSLSETINGMTVTIQTEQKGDYVLCAGEWVIPGGDSDYLTVTGEMEWDGGEGAYKYTITVTRELEADGNVWIQEVGARLPIGYSYRDGSANDFVDNLSRLEPNDELDGAGAHMLKWVFDKIKLDEENPTQTQIFYATGADSLYGHYTWVVAVRADVGTVGELSGAFYIITATAAQGGETTAVIVADVMMSAEGVPSIISWQINPK